MASVLVPLAQGCEELEAVTIIDLMRRANINVITAGLDAQTITASRGVVLTADTTLDLVLQDEFDMIVLPGGMPGSKHLNDDQRLHTLLKAMDHSGKFIAAICAAPTVLATAGLLKNRRATSYPGHLDAMNEPDITYVTDDVVRDGNITTSRGPGTAIDFTLCLIEILVGTVIRNEVEAGLLRP